MSQNIKLGTRNSALALKQANIVSQQLSATNPELTISIIPISTQGDQNKTTPLAELGGKGVFIKTLEQALLDKKIDIAVHSLKDITCTIAADTHIAAYLNPEARTDCFVFSQEETYTSINDIPKNITCATSSLRRKAILKQLRPDINIKDIRGNIDTRIQKCHDGYADAVMLSTVGLIRLNKHHLIGYECRPEECIPAGGQGVIAIQTLKQTRLPELASLNSNTQAERSYYEHYLLNQLGLDCNYPLGIYADVQSSNITLHVCWAKPDTSAYQESILSNNKEHILRDIDHLAKKIKTFF